MRQAMQASSDKQGNKLSYAEKVNNIKPCTAEQISKYSQSQHKILNDKKVDKIAQDLNIILEPLCHYDKDKELLNNNMKKLVRECGYSLASNKMSWSQSWHRFAGKIQDVAARLIDKKTGIQKLNE